MSSTISPTTSAAAAGGGDAATFSIETHITPMFKLWHIIFMAGGGILAVSKFDLGHYAARKMCALSRGRRIFVRVPAKLTDWFGASARSRSFGDLLGQS